MATMSPNIELKASLKGGLMSSISRGLGGESLIISTYKLKVVLDGSHLLQDNRVMPYITN